MIKIVILCLFVTIVVCLFLRPEPYMHVPCTHDSTLDPGSDFVTMDEFMAVRKASNVTLQIHNKHNEVSLAAIQGLKNMILGDRDFNETELEIIYDSIQSLEDYIMRINELHNAEIEIITDMLKRLE